MNNTKEKILIINMMPLGDLLLTTPFLRAVRNLWPDSKITLLADARWQDVIENNPCIDDYIALDKKRDHNTFRKQLKFIAAIRKRRFDLVINLHYNERSSMIAVFSGARLRVGYANRFFAPFMDLFQENRCLEKHIVESHYDILREKLAVRDAEIKDRGLEFYVSGETALQSGEIWNERWKGNVPEKVIGLNIGASWPTKRWPVEYFAQLAARFLQDGFGVAFFGSAPERELVEQCAGMIRDALSQSQATGCRPQRTEQCVFSESGASANGYAACDFPVAVFTGELTLAQLAAILGKCAALVTNDSGPLHIAVSQRVPTVSFYGPSPVPGFAPFNSHAVVLKSALPCHPCRKWECPLGTLQCMRNITPAIAYNETIQLLKSVAAGREYQSGACVAEIKEY